ncbi:hypothetical protein [Microvirga sp. BSC39]|uniref:hypothetical protein n=1 Tax=Microvirga sp. BSC39 TaxID=1549810 RepID=UPI0004E927E4|nr:hypothetical protein [Microvirga sp. BSC39]KFG68728.1 hypothetical protein JH26_14775 [Microvirga sp. BSC39]
MVEWDIITITVLALYFLPAAIYGLRSGESAGAKMTFALLNGALNWTVIGWLLLMNVSLDNES